MTEDLFDFALTLYTDNLSGGSPSTDFNTLPVGMQSGDLIGHAESDSKMLNQYAFVLANESPHSGFIENGTSKMLPRMPLQDAINKLDDELSSFMDETLKRIMDTT